MREKIIKLESADYPRPDSVKKLIKSMQDDGSWEAVNYKSIQISHWPAYQHLTEHVMPLAKAFANSNSTMYHDEKLVKNIHQALDFWLDHNFISLNWWPNEIGVPKTLSTILILLGKEVSSRELLQAFNQMRGSTIWQTGQNKVWRAEIQLKIGLLEYGKGRDNILGQAQERIKEASKVLQGENAIQGNKSIPKKNKNTPKAFGTGNNVVVRGKEGIQPDWSFHQHGMQLQFGNYGLSFALSQAKWAYILKNTPFQYGKHKIQVLRKYILHGLSQVVYRGTMDISGMGRNILPKKDRPVQIEKYFLHVLQIMSKADPEYASIYHQVANYNFGKAPKPHILMDNSYFWRSALMVNRSENSYMSIRMCSKKIQSTESGNGKNLLGAHLADGATYIYQSGKEYENIFPVWDWHRIPGVTSYSNKKLPEFSWGGLHNGSNFVGGVSDSSYGAAAMLFKRDSLTVHKAWFFGPNGLICLGAGIKSKKKARVLTTINQSLSKGKVIVETRHKSRTLALGQHINSPNLKWVYHDSTAYVFLKKEQVRVGSAMQEGNWQRVYDKGSQAEVNRKVFNLWVDHGSAPQNGSYSYMILPDVAPNKLANLKKQSAVKISQNTSTIQAVQYTKANLTEMIFYHAGMAKLSKSKTISVDAPCMLMVRQVNGGLKLTVSIPPELQKHINISISGHYTGNNCIYDSEKGRTTVKFNLYHGLYAGKSMSRILHDF